MSSNSKTISRTFQLLVVGSVIIVFIFVGAYLRVSSQGDSSQTYPKGFRGGACTIEAESLTVGYSGYFLPKDYEVPKDAMSTPFVPTLCGKVPGPGNLNVTIDLLYPTQSRRIPFSLRLTQIEKDHTEKELLSVPAKVYSSGVITQAFMLKEYGNYILELDGPDSTGKSIGIRIPIKVGSDWKEDMMNYLPTFSRGSHH